MVSAAPVTATHVRWGVLGAAKIATEKVIPGMQACRHARVVAIASRDGRKADAAAARLGIPRAHGSYEALIDDPNVDAIYVPLPNHLHVEWTIRAARAGKHVLCEKPMALTAADVDRVIAVRDETGVAIQEAFMYRGQPPWRAAMALIGAGRIGTPRAVSGAFSYCNLDPANVRNVKAWGGGGLYDIGCYLVNSARWVFGTEPHRVAGALDRDPVSGVDILASFLLEFPNGHAVGVCGMRHVPYQRVQIFGTAGRIEIEVPFNLRPDRPGRIFVDDGGTLDGSGADTIVSAPADQYTIQGDDLSRAILLGAPAPYPLEDTRANMAILDRLVHSAESGESW